MNIENKNCMDNIKKILFFKYKPRVKKKKWTNKEDLLFSTLSNKFQFKTKWVIISKYFEDRSSIDWFCRFRIINPELRKGKWTKEEDQIVKEMFTKIGAKWSQISKILRTRTAK